MAYTLPAWADVPSTASPLSAANLLQLNSAITDLDTRATFNSVTTAAVAGATVLTTVETVLCVLPLPANSLVVGSTFTAVLSGKSAATSVHNVRVRVGTSNSNPATNTAVILWADATHANAFNVVGVSGVSAIGASATHLGSAHMSNAAVTLCTPSAPATSGTFDSTAQTYAMLTAQNGSSTTTTIYGATLALAHP
jgi:hypothetical protein